MSADPQEVPTDRVVFEDPEASTVELVSSDDRLDVSIISRGTVAMLAALPDEGPRDAFLALKVDGHFFTLGFQKGMSPSEMLAEFARMLPSGYEAESIGAAGSNLLVVTLLRQPNTGGRAPKVHFGATDPNQRVKWAAPNKFVIEGRAARNLSNSAWIELQIEGELPVRVFVQGGDAPFETAERIRGALPAGLAAKFDRPEFPESEVTVTIVRRG